MTEDQPHCGRGTRRCLNPELRRRGHEVLCVPNCYDNTAAALWFLPEGYVLCSQQLVPGQGNGVRVSGSKERPLGLRVDVHDLMANIRGVLNEWTKYVIAGQRLSGPQIPAQRRPRRFIVGVTGATRVELRPDLDLGASTVLARARWLSRHHDWLAGSPLSIPYGEEIRDLAHEIRVLCRLYEARPEVKVGVPCRNPECRSLGLFEDRDEDRIVCPACPQRMTLMEYHEWVGECAAPAKGQ